MSKVLWAFVAGAVAGGIVGVLYAPDKGSVTRRRLKESADNISGTINEVIEMGRDVMGSTASEAEYATSEGHNPMGGNPVRNQY